MQAPPQPYHPPPVKKGMSTGCIVALVLGIVGLVVVVVIAVMAILATIGVAGSSVVLKKARILQAREMEASLRIAINGYNTEYLRLPFADVRAPEVDEEYSTTDLHGIELLKILLATGPADKNPQGYRFWDPLPVKRSGGGYD